MPECQTLKIYSRPGWQSVTTYLHTYIQVYYVVGKTQHITRVKIVKNRLKIVNTCLFDTSAI